MLNRFKALFARPQNTDKKSAPDVVLDRAGMVLPSVDGAIFNARGDALLNAGQPDEAIECFRQAVELDADDLVARIGLGRALKEKGSYADAEQSLTYAISRAPVIAEGYYFLGAVFHAQNRLDEAINQYKRATELDPRLAEAYLDLSIAYFQQGQFIYANETILKGIALNPDAADLRIYRGNLYMEANDLASALVCFDRAIDIAPDMASAHFNRGVALQGLDRHEDAIVSYDQASQLQPDFWDPANSRGVVLLKLKRFDEALACFDKALHLGADRAGIHRNRGFTLRMLNRPAEAIASFNIVLEIQPNHVGAMNNLALAQQALHQHDLALQTFARAINFEPDHAEVRLNEALCRLQLGDFTEGWQRYEWRYSPASYQNEFRDGARRPRWLGTEPLAGKTILLQAEQGYGDTLQFCRYTEQLAKSGATVFLEVQPGLKPVMSHLAGVSKVFDRTEVLPPSDYQCPLMSLPWALKTELSNIPANVPYLKSDPLRTSLWNERLGPKRKPRVGIIWSGSQSHLYDHNRSIPLAKFSKINSGAQQFVCLQKELRPEDKVLLASQKEVLFFGDALVDFADTAALVDLMDVIISVDTSVAHLVGALGKPLWLLLPFNPDFRWLLGRDDSPWYPSAKLFRQSMAHDWDPVLDSVALELVARFESA